MVDMRDRQSRLASEVGVVRVQSTAPGLDALAAGAGAVAGEVESVAKEAAARFRPAFSSDMRVRATELATKYRLDPEGFKSAWEGETKRLQAVPAYVRNDAALILNSIGDGTYRSILAAKSDNDNRNAISAAVETATATRTAYLNLVRGGKGDTPEGKSALALHQQSLLDLKTLGAINDDQVKHRLDGVADDVVATKIGDMAFEAFKKGGMAAANKVLDRLNTDPTLDRVSSNALNLTRQRLANHIREYRSAVAAANATLRKDVAEWERMRGDPRQPHRYENEAELFARVRKTDPKLYERMVKAKDFYDKADVLRTSSVPDLLKRKAELDAKDRSVGLTADEANEYKVVTYAAGANNAAIGADQIGYIHKRDPAVKAAYDEALKNPTKSNWDTYLAAADRAQAREGILGANRVVLPKGTAKGIVDTITKEPDKFKQYQTVIGLKQTYGAAWPRVFAQLVKEGLPATTEVMAGMRNPTAAVKYAEALSVGDKAMADALGTDKVKDIREEVPKVTADLMVALNRSGGGAKVDLYSKAVRTLAYKYAAEGDDPRAAVDRAYQDVIGDRYTFAHNGKVPVMVPRVLANGQPANVSKIEVSMRGHLTLENLKAANIDITKIRSRFLSANLPKPKPGEVGVDTGIKTKAGRPLYLTPEGELVSEKSITVTDPRLNYGAPTNIPSIWGGRRYDDEGAVEQALKSGQKFESFSSIDSAVEAARKRSAGLITEEQSRLVADKFPALRAFDAIRKTYFINIATRGGWRSSPEKRGSILVDGAGHVVHRFVNGKSVQSFEPFTTLQQEYDRFRGSGRVKVPKDGASVIDLFTKPGP